MSKKFPCRRFAAPLLAAGLTAASLAACKSGAEASQPCTQNVDLSKFGTYALIFFTQLDEYTNPQNPNYQKAWGKQKQNITGVLAAQKPPAGLGFVMNVRAITGNAAQATRTANQVAPIAGQELGYSGGGGPRPLGVALNNVVEISIDPVAPACESSNASGTASSYLGEAAVTSFNTSIFAAPAAHASLVHSGE